MRSRSLASEHDTAVARRLELLTSELAQVRDREADTDHGHLPGYAWTPDSRPLVTMVADRGAPALEDGVAERAGATVASVPRLPGRHASRRPSRWESEAWSALVPEGFQGRVSLGSSQVAVVAVVVALGLAATCWWLLRSGGHEVGVPEALSTQAAALATPSGAPAGGETEGAGVTGAAATDLPSGPARAQVVVDVSGKVRHPGIAVLRQGARVIDALRAAGGARRGVDLGGLNLARVLTDGEQVVVGGPSAVAGVPASSAPGASSAASPASIVDINTADQPGLESLPGVGPVTAQAILAWRAAHGGFTSIDQLLDVDGIGDATLAKLTPFVTL